MSALSDLLHSVVEKLPFHSQSQQEEAHALVEKADQELTEAVDKVKNFVVGSGVKTAADVTEVHGTDQNATPSVESDAPAETPES